MLYSILILTCINSVIFIVILALLQDYKDFLESRMKWFKDTLDKYSYYIYWRDVWKFTWKK